jgi:hypothetical protein
MRDSCSTIVVPPGTYSTPAIQKIGVRQQYAAKLTRSLRALGKAEKARDGAGNISADEKANEQATALRGWAELDIDGLLR